jgi:hypothetical protein
LIAVTRAALLGEHGLAAVLSLQQIKLDATAALLDAGSLRLASFMHACRRSQSSAHLALSAVSVRDAYVQRGKVEAGGTRACRSMARGSRRRRRCREDELGRRRRRRRGSWARGRNGTVTCAGVRWMGRSGVGRRNYSYDWAVNAS